MTSQSPKNQDFEIYVPTPPDSYARIDEMAKKEWADTESLMAEVRDAVTRAFNDRNTGTRAIITALKDTPASLLNKGFGSMFTNNDEIAEAFLRQCGGDMLNFLNFLRARPDIARFPFTAVIEPIMPLGDAFKLQTLSDGSYGGHLGQTSVTFSESYAKNPPRRIEECIGFRIGVLGPKAYGKSDFLTRAACVADVRSQLRNTGVYTSLADATISCVRLVGSLDQNNVQLALVTSCSDGRIPSFHVEGGRNTCGFRASIWPNMPAQDYYKFIPTFLMDASLNGHMSKVTK